MLNLWPAAYLVYRWILRPPFLDSSIPELDLRLQVRTNDVIWGSLYEYQSHEPEVSHCLSNHVRFESGGVVLELGANVGWYSLIIEKMARIPLDILAFALDPNTFGLLAENIRRNSCQLVTGIQAASGPEASQQIHYRSAKGNAGRHALLPIHSTGLETP